MPYYFLSQDLELAETEKVELTNELENLVSQTHARYQKLTYIRCAQYYSYGWKDSTREPSQRVFPNGPRECDEVAGVEDGIYDDNYYIRKHNLVIDYLRDEDVWQNPQSDANINEDQQVLFLYRIYFNYREEHLLLISFPSDLCFVRGANLQESVSETVPVNTSAVTLGEIPTQPTASEFQPPTPSEETQGLASAVITTTILK